MRQYDFAFSCGFQCGASMALREAGLQFASYPFDWTTVRSFPAAAKIIASDFAGWLESPDNLELIDVRRGGLNKSVWLDHVTGCGYVHDFSLFRTFEEMYSEVREKYRRRIGRLQKDLRRAKTALAVCTEVPKRGRAPDAELIEGRRLLEERFPGTKFDVLYFYPGDGDPVPHVVADGITAVAVECRTYENGELDHTVDTTRIARYLRENVTVTDPRTEEEKAQYLRDWTKQDRARWHGRNWLETFWIRTKYRQYRRLEKFLIEKRLVPRERPLWALWEHPVKGPVK